MVSHQQEGMISAHQKSDRFIKRSAEGFWRGDRFDDFKGSPCLTTRFKYLLDRQWEEGGDRSPDCSCGYWILGVNDGGRSLP
jgi:hypothetical protein